MALVVSQAAPFAAKASEPLPGPKPTLYDVLAADARDSPSGCPSVEFDDSLSPVPSASAATPPNPAGVTPVDLSMFVLAIDEIDTRTNSFRFEAYATLVWCDPRVGFDPAEAGTDRRVRFADKAMEQLGSMWWPGVFQPAQLGEPELSNQQLVVHADGTVRVSVKINSRVIARYDFSDFPLDHQTLRIVVQPSLLREDQLGLRANERLTGFDQGFEIPEWKVLGAATRMDRAPTADGSDGFRRVVFEIEIGRKVGFYVWKIGLPLLLIVGVSWSVFWMTRDVLAQRQRQAATGLLTLVAYQFVAFSDVPRVSYLTLLDTLFLWSFVVVASTLALNVVNIRRFREDPARGLRADRRWRWLYPSIYLAGIAVILLRHRLL